MSEYKTIFNPETNKFVDINRKIGKKILQKYMGFLHGGSGRRVNLRRVYKAPDKKAAANATAVLLQNRPPIYAPHKKPSAIKEPDARFLENRTDRRVYNEERADMAQDFIENMCQVSYNRDRANAAQRASEIRRKIDYIKKEEALEERKHNARIQWKKELKDLDAANKWEVSVNDEGEVKYTYNNDPATDYNSAKILAHKHAEEKEKEEKKEEEVEDKKKDTEQQQLDLNEYFRGQFNKPSHNWVAYWNPRLEKFMFFDKSSDPLRHVESHTFYQVIEIEKEKLKIEEAKKGRWHF